MIPIDEPDWFEADVVLAIHSRQLAEHGGQPGIRDEGMLESALARPRQKWAYENADLYDLAAAYAYGISKNHPFLDGNKRTAAVICETFIELHDHEIKLDETAKYPHYLSLAAGEHTEESFALWLRENSAPTTP